MSKILDNRVTDAAREALDATGLDWDVTMGSRHLHVRLAGRLVGILPKSGPQQSTDMRSDKNQVAQIRRMAEELGVARPAPAPKAANDARPRAKPHLPKALAKPAAAAPQPPSPPRAEAEPWRPGMPTPPLLREPGWIGKFTRAQAPGALPNGTRVVKLNDDPTGAVPVASQGAILGSLIHPTKPARLYFVEWDDKPREAFAIMGRKIGKLKT